MTALITGDLHLNDNDRDAYRHELMRDLPMLANKVGAKEVVILGDLTTEKDRHRAKLVNRIVDHVMTLAKTVRVYFDKGNHDYTDPEHPFFKFFRHMPNVRWINKPTQVTLSIGPVLFLPHTYNYKRDWDGIDFDNYGLIFAHNTFDGAIGNNGHTLEGIPPSIFGSRPFVVSGDVHTPQLVGRNIRYVGAPYTVDFGDEYTPRMIVADGANGAKLRSLLVPGPQKRLIEHHSLLPDKAFTNLHAGDIVKIRIMLLEKEQPHWAKIRDTWRKWAEDQGFRVAQIQPVVERRSAGVARSAPTRKDDDATLASYSKARGVGTATFKVGQDIIRRV